MYCRKLQIVFFLCSLFLFEGCSTNAKDKSEPVQYIHLSHFKIKPTPFISPQISNLDLKEYQVVMLGGDLADSTTKDVQAMEYLDSIFDFDNENTLWSVGNHDFAGDTALIQEFTERKHHFAHTKNGVCFLILDTQMDSSNIVNEQLDFVDSLLDTIQKSTHLIVLHHKLIWLYNNSTFNTDSINKVSNAHLGNCNYCLNPNNFNKRIYPKLKKVQKQGIQVICIGGDVGKKVKEFEHITEDGVVFLGSGIEENDTTNKVLIFNHDLNSKQLTWEFKPVNEF